MREDYDGAWFAPKRYGFGTGLPIRWQGWAMLASYLALTIAGPALFAPLWYVWTPVVIIATTGLILVAKKHTRGGWRWRWGERD